MATRDQLISALRRADAAGNDQDAQRIAQMIKSQQAPADNTNQGPGVPKDITSAVLGGIVNTATLGLANRAEDLIQSGARALGLPSETPQHRRERQAETAQQHPVASLVGQGIGLVGGASAGGKAIGAAEKALAGSGTRVGKYVAALLHPAETTGKRLAQYGAGGALASGVAETADSPSPSLAKAVEAATVGGAVGAAGGPIAERAISAVAPATRKAWRLMAKKLQTPVDELVTYMQTGKQMTGHYPTIAHAIQARDSGAMKQLAAANHTVGTGYNAEARNMAGRDLNLGKIEAARDKDFTDAMDPIRDQGVAISEDLLADPSFFKGVPRSLRKKVKDIADGVGGPDLTVGEADTIRRKLRRLQNSPANLGEDYKEIADDLAGEVAQQHPSYGKALEDYTGASRLMEGFQHGMTGRDATEATGDMARALGTAEGRHGFEAGRIVGQGQRNVRNVAPDVPMPQRDIADNASEVARGAAHGVVGSKGLGLFHVIRGLMPGHLSEGAQREIVDHLFSRDPKTIRRAVARLREAGADNNDIRRIGLALATATGGSSGASMAGNEVTR